MRTTSATGTRRFRSSTADRDRDGAAAGPDVGDPDRLGIDAARPGAVRRRIVSATTASTSRSVSGRGISARASVAKAIPKNSLIPRM